jgi:FAD/FMN-containing dehydrogenase
MNAAFVNDIPGALRDLLPEIASTGDPAELKGYGDGGPAPAAAVFPENKEQVQRLVRLAGSRKLPLVPVSSGPPHARAVSSVPGAVIVDFGRMKRIFKIDGDSRYAWIEPGVTFGELVPALRQRGLRLNMPFLPSANKSVVASLLEREPVLIPKYQYDYVDPLLTLEVVYGTGDDFRTGSASGPGSLDTLKADKVNPWGPGSFDYMRFLTGAQGTMGLVTWAVTKTEILPKLRRLYFVASEDLGPLVDLANGLLRKRVGDECLILNHVHLAALLERNAGAAAPLRAALPRWTMLICVAGYDRYPEERAALQEKSLFELSAGLGLKPAAALAEAPGAESMMLERLSGCWDEETHWKLRHHSGCRDIFFLAPMSRVAGLTAVMAREAEDHRFPGERIGVYIQPLVQGRGCHVEFSLFFEKGDAASAEALFADASRTLIQSGAYFSRPYGNWAEMVYEGDPEGVGALKKLKGIFDPENILNPGKLCFKAVTYGQPE